MKVDPAGSVVYSTFINGATEVNGIALDTAGDVFLTGLGPLTGSATNIQPARGFVMEVNAALDKVLLSTNGYGGGLIALDSQGSIYVTGSAQPSLTQGTNELTLPILSAGAFQPDSRRPILFYRRKFGPEPVDIDNLSVPICRQAQFHRSAGVGDIRHRLVGRDRGRYGGRQCGECHHCRDHLLGRLSGYAGGVRDCLCRRRA